MKLYKDENGKIFGVGEESDLGGDQSFLIQKDWKLMTAEEVELYINPPKTAQQIQLEVNEVSSTYLASTDWYVTRFIETGVAIPDDVKTKRQEARDAIK